MNPLWYVGAFVVAIGLLVTIHELGHYVVARLCGVKVLRFSLGFGRVVWSYRTRPEATEWAISLIPLGGYVKMLDEREGEVAPAELPQAFTQKSVWRRIAIVAAGPFANLLLASVIYWGFLIHGVSELRAVLAAPAAQTAAAAGGVQAGDQVIKVGERAVASWNDFHWELIKHVVDQPRVELAVLTRSGEQRVRVISTEGVRVDDDRADPVQGLGLQLERPKVPARLGQVLPGSAAEMAGLKSGDLVTEINGKVISDWSDLVAQISGSAGRELPIIVLRDSQTLSLRVTPKAEEDHGRKIGRIGVGYAEDAALHARLFVEVKHGPIEAIGLAVRKTWETAGFSLRMMGRMLTGEVSLRNISGPVTIADYAGQSARMGFEPYVRFLALISISIGVLNLLPVPLLDGGHIMYYLAEILMRRPVSQRTMELGQQVGFAVLALLMAFAFINDISRLLS